jgi:hypothetical protein
MFQRLHITETNKELKGFMAMQIHIVRSEAIWNVKKARIYISSLSEPGYGNWLGFPCYQLNHA